MNKKFWVIIISFWIACIIAGSCTYFYIYYSQKQERKQFVAEFNYEDVTEMQEKSSISPNAQYDTNAFLNEIQQVIESMNQYEENISPTLHNKDTLNSNLEYILTAYQQAKFKMEQFANVEITNSSLVQKKQFEEIANATYHYLHASSIYFIISAKKLKYSTDFLEQQHKAAKDTLITSKSKLLAVMDLYSEDE